MSLYYSHRYDEAIAFAKQWLELYPDSIGIHDVLAESYAQEGLESLTVKEYLKAAELGGSSPSRIAALEKASRASGLRGLWQMKLALDEEKAASQRFGAEYDVAHDCAILGYRDESLRWLERRLTG